MEWERREGREEKEGEEREGEGIGGSPGSSYSPGCMGARVVFAQVIMPYSHTNVI